MLIYNEVVHPNEGGGFVRNGNILHDVQDKIEEVEMRLKLAAKLSQLSSKELGLVVIMNWGKWVASSSDSYPSFYIPRWFRIIRYLNDAVSAKDCLAIENFVARWLVGFKLNILFTQGGECVRKIGFRVFHNNTLMVKDEFVGTIEGAGDLIQRILTLWAEKIHGVILFDGRVHRLE